MNPLNVESIPTPPSYHRWYEAVSVLDEDSILIVHHAHFSQECSHIFMVASASPLLFASWQFPRVFGMYSSHSPICWQHTVSAAWFSLQFLGCRISQTENFDGETNHKPPDFFWPLFWDNPICQVAQSTTNIYKSCNPPTEKTHHILHLWISPLYPAISIFHLYSIDIP